MSDLPLLEPTVFIVDDDDSVRHSLMTIAESLGLPVKCFSAADEFLNLCDSSCSGCLILDIRMPEMNGFELHKKLKAQGVRLPVIMMTGHGDRSMAQGAAAEEIIEFLEKPFSPKKLIEALAKAMNSSGPLD